MTTIVYDHKLKLIAFDGREFSGGYIKSDSVMKYKEADGKFWFMAGSVCDEDRFIDRFLSGKTDKPSFPIDATAIVVDNKAAWIYGITDEGECFKHQIEYNDAIGSGAQFALAALDFGKAAAEAVAYAATKDSRTGGNIIVFDLLAMEFLNK